MTPTREQIRALCDAATDGEWHVVGLPWNNGLPYIIAGHYDPHVGKAIIDLLDQDEFSGEDDEDIERQMAQFEAEQHANARFIAASRAIIPHLLDEVERLEKALEEYSKPENWTVTDEGMNRIWLEPDSATPEAYHGYELAQQALGEKT